MLVSVGATEPGVDAAATIGNGFMSYSFASGFIYVAGVYNGPAQSANPSHRAAIPNPQAIGVPGDMQYAGLNLLDATYTRVYNLPGSKCVVTQFQYVHQTNLNLLVQQITIDNSQSTEICYVEFDTDDVSSSDVQIIQQSTTAEYELNIFTTRVSEEASYPDVHIAVVSFPSSPVANLLPGTTQTLNLYTAITTSLDSTDPGTAALAAYRSAQKAQVQALLESHKSAWHSNWEGRIEVGGNLGLAQVINSSYYYLLSSMHTQVPWSISPGGLASNGYNGHMFWDAETWMYPPILFFHPDIAHDSFLEYRLNHLEGARQKAKSYNLGYQGTMFPWESAATGIETCPTTAPTGQLEQHISGDIALAVRQYFYVTGELNFLAAYKPLIEGIAQFWVSRVKPSATQPGKYDINGVIPPDEFAVNVNNSAYTNYVAKISLEWYLETYTLLGINDPLGARKIADGLWVPFDEKNQIHLEFEGYNGVDIKQADVVMLSYPLEMNMTTAVQKNDLIYYQDRIAEGGPAMTWAMHTIGWLDLNEPKRAAELFARSFANSHKPFGVWTETPTGGATNFVTGAGGFLQGLINGYGGARLGRFSYSFKPQLPPNTTSMALRGVSLFNSTFDVAWDTQTITITATSLKANAYQLTLTYNGKSTNLALNQPINVPAGTSFTVWGKAL